MKVRISPSILGADFSNLRSELKKIEEAGADSIHFDIMDRHFVPNLTFGPLLLKSLRPYTKLPFSVHLMTENPDLYIDECVRNGAALITVHQEASVHLHRTLSAIRQGGVKAGVAVNPASDLSFFKYVSDLVDEILIMTVNPGFSGQSLIRAALSKAGEARRLIREAGTDASVNVDGGINVETARDAVNLGADTLVMASAFFGAENPAEVVRKIKEYQLKK